MPPHTAQQRQQRLRLANGSLAGAASDPSVSQSEALVQNEPKSQSSEASNVQPAAVGPMGGRSYGAYGSGSVGGYGGGGMYGSYGGGYGSSMYGGYPRYGGGYGGGYGMGGYGSYGMGSYGGYSGYGGYGGGYGMMGMDGAGSGWLFKLHLLLTSMGQLTELIGMNTQALQYFFGNVVGLVDGALQLLSPSPPELLEDAEIREDDDEQVKRHKIQQQRRDREIKRLKFIRWALVLLAAFATYRTVKNMFQRGASALLSRPRISHGSSNTAMSPSSALGDAWK